MIKYVKVKIKPNLSMKLLNHYANGKTYAHIVKKAKQPGKTLVY